MECYNTPLAGNFLIFLCSIVLCPPWTKLACLQALGRRPRDSKKGKFSPGRQQNEMLQRKLNKSQSKKCNFTFFNLSVAVQDHLKKGM